MGGGQLTCLPHKATNILSEVLCESQCHAPSHAIKGALDVSFPPPEQHGSYEVKYLGNFVVQGLKLNGLKPQLWESHKISRGEEEVREEL